uniref:VIgL family SRCR-related protein n=1 Tax=Littorina littorea TaxID=31216 RepID=A0A411DEL1_LITLI|nr:VIgL family SRCR-related protein [Littorina littorea]
MLLVLIGALVVLQGTDAFTWKVPLNNGTTVHRCVGHDVTFPWSYVTERNENVMAVFWFSDKNGTIATLFANHFMTSSERLTSVPNAGITLSGLTTEDVGIYGVHVRLYNNKQLKTHVINLVVVDPPTTTDRQLRIDQQSHNASSTGHDSCDPKIQLRCGQILSAGFPPLSVEWTDPEGEKLTSTDYQDGFFLLGLPSDHKGGNYTCSLVLDQEVSTCLQSDSPFITSATLFVETMDTKVKEQGESLELLKNEVEEFKTNAGALLSDETQRAMVEVQERLSNLESTADNLTEQVDNDRAFTHKLYEMNVNRIKDLQKTSQEALDDLMKNTGQDLREHHVNWMQSLNAVTGNMSENEQTIADHDKKIADLRQQVSTLQGSLDDEQKHSGELQKKVDNLLGDLTQQKTLTSDLQDQLLKLQTEADKQETANTQQADEINGLKASVEAVLKTLETQGTISTNLTKKLSELEGDLEAQKTITDEQERISSQFLPSLAEVQHSLAQQKTSIENLDDKLNQEMNEQEKKLSGVKQELSDLQQGVNKLSSDTASQLSNLTDTLKWVHANLTFVEKLQETGEQFMREHLQNSTESFYDDLLFVLQRVNELNESVTSTLTSMSSAGTVSSSQLAALETSLTAVESQYGSLLPRVQTVEGDLVTVNEKLFPVRLVGGSNEREGRVEIRVGLSWGTVCDDGWDVNEARVVCNMLGFFKAGAVAKPKAAFGHGTGPIVLDDIKCTGSEQDIRFCPASPFGTHNCAHGEDAGVICAG